MDRWHETKSHKRFGYHSGDRDAKEDLPNPKRQRRRDAIAVEESDDDDEKMPQRQQPRQENVVPLPQQQQQQSRQTDQELEDKRDEELWFSFAALSVNPWTERANDLTNHHANARAMYMDKNRLRSQEEIMIDRLRPDRKTSGHERWALFDELINGLGISWTAEQQLLIDACKRSLLRCFFGEDWERERMRMMKDLSLDEQIMMGKPTVMNMPRQFGKSTVLRAIVAVALVVLPGRTFVVFSPAQRTSHIFTDGVIGMLHKIPGARERICRNNTEELKLAANPLDAGMQPGSAQAKSRCNEPTTSTLWSLPASEKGKLLGNTGEGPHQTRVLV